MAAVEYSLTSTPLCGYQEDNVGSFAVWNHGNVAHDNHRRHHRDGTAADAISQAIDEKVPGIIGIHFEGLIFLYEKGLTVNSIFGQLQMQNGRYLSELIWGK